MSVTVYATIDDLTSLALTPEAVKRMPVAQLDAILAQCSRTANMYLGQRYQLPLVAHGADLTQIVCALAAYQIMTVRGWNPENPADRGIVQLRNDALALLKEVARGNASLDVVSTSPEPMEEPDAYSDAPREYV